MRYKLVIFDLDGTILNTIEDLKNACNYALSKYNLKNVNVKQVESYLGYGIRHLMKMASNNHPDLDDLLKDFRAYYTNHFNDYTKPYEGIINVLNYCLDNNIRIGVLTNKVEDIAVKLCNHHFPNLFEFVYGEISGRSRKPDPEFLLSIIANLGLNNRDILYIGDSDVDVNVSKNACVDCLAVSYGFRPEKDLLAITSNVVKNPDQIIDYLKGV